MRVSVETTNGLVRKATVAVPSESFEERVAERVKSTASDLKLPGFRPGKVPLTEVRRRFGDRLRREVANDLLQSSFAEAIRQEELALAGNPSIEIVTLEAGRDLEYVATFEVLPNIDLAPLDQLRVRRPQAEIEESDIDATVQSLREQRTEWQPVERTAETGDRVKLDYAIKVDGKTVAEQQDTQVILGQTQTHSDLANALPGMSTAETRAFPISWRSPPDSGAEDATPDEAAGTEEPQGAESPADNDAPVPGQLADAEVAPAAAIDADLAGDTGHVPPPADESDSDGLPAEASAEQGDAEALLPEPRQGIGEVTVHAIEEPHLPEVDDAFMDWFGVEQGEGRAAKFRANVRERMQLELDAATRRTLNVEVTRALADAHEFELPEAMVEAELRTHQKRWRSWDEALANVLRPMAERQVRARLVMREIVSQQAITPDDQRIRSRIDEIAGGYEEADEIRRWIYSDEEQLNRIENAVLEEQVVDHVLEHAQVVTVAAAYQDVAAGNPLPELAEDEDDAAEAAPAEPEAIAEPVVVESSSTEPLQPSDAAIAEAAPEPQADGIGGKLRRLFGRSGKKKA